MSHPWGGQAAEKGMPDAIALADLVSSVTEIAFGASFVPGDDLTRGPSICGRMVLLPIEGPREIFVVLSCDAAGGQALSAALRGCPANQLTRAMVDDAIAELLNMVAGRIQTALEIDQPLGLPRPTSLAEIAERSGVGFNDAILLTSTGFGDLKMWIFERAAPDDTAPPALKKAGPFRSFFRKLTS